MTEEWKKIRSAVLRRDGNLCQECGETEQLHVHHVLPRALGGEDAPSNLITLCSSCHAVRHPFLQASLSRRFIERWALRIAKWLDRNGEVLATPKGFGAALRIFGLQRFRDTQIDVVLAAMSGQSVLLVSPTGSGKSLCYQLPAVLSNSVTYVISPLKALMTDQVIGLHRNKIPATYINSDISKTEKKMRYEMLGDNAWKLLYCTPERFDDTKIHNKSEIVALQKAKPSYLVIDEAHCIDKWGSDFRQSYSRLKEVRASLGNPPVLAFTATASKKVQKRIIQSLGIESEAKVIVHDIDRPNVALLRIPLAKGSNNEEVSSTDYKRAEHIANLLRLIRTGRAMIFVPTRKVGEKVSLLLADENIEAPFYHSKLDNMHRTTIMGRFTGVEQPPLRYVVCTNAFGMGLDLPDVRLVIHWQHPSSVEDYLQEFGRCGRDGKQSLAVLFTSKDDVGLLEFMAKTNTRSSGLGDVERDIQLEQRIESIKDMSRLATSKRRCFRKGILDYFGGDISKTKLSLGVRIIRFFFTVREHNNRTEFCCDRCNKVSVDTYRHWARSVLSEGNGK